jgi:hypothetical protein
LIVFLLLKAVKPRALSHWLLEEWLTLILGFLQLSDSVCSIIIFLLGLDDVDVASLFRKFWHFFLLIGS